MWCIMKYKHMFLNIFVIKFPLTAISSIIHRITGIGLFLLMPFVLYFFKLSVESDSSFFLAKSLFNEFIFKFMILILGSFFIFHLIAGFKHILMDMGFFYSKESSGILTKISLILISLIIFILILGIFI
jgi:succinate dehydrogenase / fumarate reductase, cytochrome b subunit